MDCETPPTISNGSPGASTATLLGENVTYTCNNGYMMSQGVSVATVSCLATGNWETIPICLGIVWLNITKFTANISKSISLYNLLVEII